MTVVSVKRYVVSVLNCIKKTFHFNPQDKFNLKHIFLPLLLIFVRMFVCFSCCKEFLTKLTRVKRQLDLMH